VRWKRVSSPVHFSEILGWRNSLNTCVVYRLQCGVKESGELEIIWEVRRLGCPYRLRPDEDLAQGIGFWGHTRVRQAWQARTSIDELQNSTDVGLLIFSHLVIWRCGYYCSFSGFRFPI
jgi:hypothetical protein